MTITAIDNATAFTGAVSFTWTITNTVSVTNPGDQSNVSGTADHRPAHHRLGLLGGATFTYSDGGTLPAGALHRRLERRHHRHPDHRRCLVGHHHRHRSTRLDGQHQLHLDGDQHGVGDQPR